MMTQVTELAYLLRVGLFFDLVTSLINEFPLHFLRSSARICGRRPM